MIRVRRILFWIILVLAAVVLLALSWKSTAFADFYVRYIFPIWISTFGRVTGKFSFSLGEVLIIVGVFYVLITLILWIVRFFLFISHKDFLKKIVRFNSKLFPKIIAIVVIVMILNCYILYHESTLMAGTVYEEYEPTKEDLLDFRETLVKRANSMAENFERDDKGYIIYDTDLEGIATVTMQGLGERAKLRIGTDEEGVLDKNISKLSGYLSEPKPFFFSWFFSQQYMEGYYFPFSLEANYNDLMYIANKPATMCHELCHLKGFIYEDEATFLAYLGCMESGDNLFIYSATLSALSYVESDVKRATVGDLETRAELTPISDLVKADSVFLTDEAWETVNEKAFIDTETVHEASNNFVNTYLTLNGVEEGKLVYGKVVQLLLKYYYGGE